jgi:hypothetical protein
MKPCAEARESNRIARRPKGKNGRTSGKSVEFFNDIGAKRSNRHTEDVRAAVGTIHCQASLVVFVATDVRIIMPRREDRVDGARPPLRQRFGKGSMVLVGCFSIGAILVIFIGAIVVYGGINAG